MGTPWDARTYDRTSEPQQSWAQEVLERLRGISPDATVLDIGCGTGRVTEQLAELVPQGRVLAIDASSEMVALARARLGARARVWCADAVELELQEPVDAVLSTAALHWVTDHDTLWARVAACMRAGGALEVQCGGRGNIARVREAISAAVEQLAPQLAGFSPWTFAGPEETSERLRRNGFESVRCWLQERPTQPEDLGTFVRTSILAAHLERLEPERRDAFCEAVLARVRPPLDYVRLNVSAVRAKDPSAGR